MYLLFVDICGCLIRTLIIVTTSYYDFVAISRFALSHNVVSSTPRLYGIRPHNVSGDRH